MSKPIRKKKVKNILSGLSGIITAWIVWLLLEKKWGEWLEDSMLEPDPLPKPDPVPKVMLSTSYASFTGHSCKQMNNALLKGLLTRWNLILGLWRGLAAYWVSGSVSAPYKMCKACRFRATLKIPLWGVNLAAYPFCLLEANAASFAYRVRTDCYFFEHQINS